MSDNVEKRFEPDIYIHTCRETADIISHMFKNNNNKEFVLVKINVKGSLEMLSKDTYNVCWQAAKLCQWAREYINVTVNCELMF